jgi:hypothetical protein
MYGHTHCHRNGALHVTALYPLDSLNAVDPVNGSFDVREVDCNVNWNWLKV